MIKIGTQTPISDILPPPGWQGCYVSEKENRKISLIPIQSKSFSQFSFWGECLVSVILVQFSQIPRAIYLNAVVLQNINLHNSRPIIFMVPTRQYQFNFFTFFSKVHFYCFFLNKLAREKPGKEISRDRKWRIASDPVFHREKARVFIFWRFPCTL